jgi:hypothetical protein
VLPSIGNEVVKSVVAQYNAEQLLTQREKVRAVACPCCPPQQLIWCAFSRAAQSRLIVCAVDLHPLYRTCQCTSLLPTIRSCHTLTLTVHIPHPNNTLLPNAPTPQVSYAVRESLKARAADFNIALEDVAITHLSFGTEFTKAVEMKQVAEQDAERARFVVLKAEQVGRGCVCRGWAHFFICLWRPNPTTTLPPMQYALPRPPSLAHQPSITCTFATPPPLHKPPLHGLNTCTCPSSNSCSKAPGAG